MLRISRNTLVLGCVLAALAVLLGAFAAHGLKNYVSTDQIQTFQTGVRYQFYHAFGLICLGLISLHTGTDHFKWSIISISLGVLFFSGSLYVIATTPIHQISTKLLGPITPIGGLFMIGGWILAIYQLLRIPITKA